MSITEILKKEIIATSLYSICRVAKMLNINILK